MSHSTPVASPSDTRYVVEQTPVGKGGYGKVRPGTDTILERKIAVKSLDPVYEAATPDDKERFRREARILAKLSHPNIPAIYDVVFDGDRFEFVFQYVEGTNLRAILAEEESLQISECRSWFDQIASALQHAHDNGIIHRDIKPENMIVTRDRRHCYLVDFGIALSKDEIERLTGSDNWIGTPGYMSPEQIECAELDSSDDIYVLGVCLYEALSGHRMEQGDYKPLSTLNELIPEAVDDLIRKRLASKPRRLKSAGEFRSLLKAAFSGHRTLSEVLRVGSLHEVIDVIAGMSPLQFSEMKAGQRLLILQKGQDMVAEKERRLVAARNELLAELTRLGIYLSEEEYGKIVDPAIRFGLGQRDAAGKLSYSVPIIREALINAAGQVGVQNHRVLVGAFMRWLSEFDLEKQKSGLYHYTRLLLNGLMANPECHDDDAPVLAKVLQQVNDLQRSNRAYDGEW